MSEGSCTQAVLPACRAVGLASMLLYSQREEVVRTIRVRVRLSSKRSLSLSLSLSLRARARARFWVEVRSSVLKQVPKGVFLFTSTITPRAAAWLSSLGS